MVPNAWADCSSVGNAAKANAGKRQLERQSSTPTLSHLHASSQQRLQA